MNGQAVGSPGVRTTRLLEALKQRCRKISALIYQPVSRRESAPAGDETSTPAGKPARQSGGSRQLHRQRRTTRRLVRQRGKPLPDRPARRATVHSSARDHSAGTTPPETTPHRDPTAARSPPAIDGAFHYEKRPITGLRTPVMAKVRFAVTAEGGKKLPPNLRRSVVIGSLLIEKNKEGMMRLMETPEIQVQEVGTPIANLIYQDAVSLRPQIRFFRPPADRFQSKLELVAVSTGQSIEPVEENCEYVVRFEISTAGLEKLQGLLKDITSFSPETALPLKQLYPSEL